MSQVGAVGLNAHGQAVSVPCSALEWDTYWLNALPHRQTVTRLILDSASKGASLCVWGAGTCHDLSLPELVEHCSSITLVDFNTHSLERGIEFQGLTGTESVRGLSPVDLAGTFTWRQERDAGVSSAEVPSLISGLKQHKLPELGRYDIVVSAGMLSQVFVDIADAIDLRNKNLESAYITARRRHLQLMIDHLKPGGVGLLISDILNTDDVPELVATDDLSATVSRVLEANPSLQALAPANLMRDLLVHPTTASSVSRVANTDYWLWKMTQRVYACYAVQFQLSAEQKGIN